MCIHRNNFKSCIPKDSKDAELDVAHLCCLHGHGLLILHSVLESNLCQVKSANEL